MSSSPVRVTVSEVRQKIFEKSGRPSEGAGSVAGQIFHRAAGCAVTDGHPACWRTVLSGDLEEAEWLSSLYERVVGPELARMQGALSDCGEDVLTLWRAVQQYVHWFCGLLREAMNQKRVQYDSQREFWIGAESLFQSECDVESLFSEEGWKQPVLVSGRLDQFIRSGPDRWCAVEFKLGGGHPEADAAQVCLYHEMLGGRGSAALLHFGTDPKEEELLFHAAQIDEARPWLVALIGALARVAPTTPKGISLTAVGDPIVAQKVTEEAGEMNAGLGKKLERALEEFGAGARVVGEPIVGPTFVRYLLEPQRGVPVRRIETCGPNLQIRLGLDREPIIHRVEGRVAVDIQRRQRAAVSFADLSPKLGGIDPDQGSAKVLAGMDLRGGLHFVDLSRDCPHILVGGHAGSGKTEWLRAAVASLIVTNTPETLRVAVVDPKKNAFTELAGSPFLWRSDALIDSPDSSVLSLLDDLVEEVTRRNGLLGQAAADDLVQYRRKTGGRLPRLVCVVDEFAELLLSGGRKQRDDFEQRFTRIAAVGRAAGVHLILATQRPSRQVVSGNLKANLPGKIALRVSTRTDSGVLIDQTGAENLLGRGDLLLAGLTSDPVRLQSAYLSEEERQRIFRGLSFPRDAG